MKLLTLLLSILSFNTMAATITSSTDQLLQGSEACNSKEIAKKTILLIDTTVDDKSELTSALIGFEDNINSIYKSDNKDFLLNHKFQLSRVDENGEHASDWQVQTSKEYGSKFSRLNNSLFELKSNIDNTIQKITSDKKTYTSTLLIEQIVNYSNSLSKCDHLVVFSDLLLVDHEGNNFERGRFTKPTALPKSNGNIVLFRIGKKGQSYKEIKKVQAWWEESLNQTQSFTNNYSLKPTMSVKNNRKEKRVISSVAGVDAIAFKDKISNTQSAVEKLGVDEIKEADAVIPTDELQTSPPLDVDEPVLSAPYRKMLTQSPKSTRKVTEELDEDDEFAFDDFSDLGIDVNQLNETSNKAEKKEITIAPAPALKKEVDPRLLRLSCDEFTSRLLHEALPACHIELSEAKNSKLELTLNESGRISNYENSLNVATNKLLCLSGYISGKPANGVGQDFTCRVVIQ